MKDVVILGTSLTSVNGKHLLVRWQPLDQFYWQCLKSKSKYVQICCTISVIILYIQKSSILQKMLLLLEPVWTLINEVAAAWLILVMSTIGTANIICELFLFLILFFTFFHVFSKTNQTISSKMRQFSEITK